MANTPFDKLIEDEKVKLATESLGLGGADPLKSERLRGISAGLDKARELFRQAARGDAIENE